MKQKISLGGSITILIGVVIGILAVVRGPLQTGLLLGVFALWGLWVLLTLLRPAWRANKAYRCQEERAAMSFGLRRRPMYGSLVKITLKPVSSNGNNYSVAVFNRVRDFAGEELEGVKAYAEGFRAMVEEMLKQQAKTAQEEAVANAVEQDGEPLVLEDNADHFAVGGLVDGERDALPA